MPQPLLWPPKESRTPCSAPAASSRSPSPTRAPHDYETVKAQDAFRYPPFFRAMLDAGVSLPPSVFEAWFVSAAHDDRAVEQIIDALPGAARAAAAA